MNSLKSIREGIGINNVITTLRLSIDTKKKLSKYLRHGETYEQGIRRLMETNNQLMEEMTFLKSLVHENKDLIKYIESEFKRVQKTFSYHPDLKIECSYNDSKIRSHGGFVFDLHIDSFILSGSPVTNEEGLRVIQTIDIMRSLKNFPLRHDVNEIIKNNELILDSKEEFIRTKYFVYFKLLYLIINKVSDRGLREEDIFELDFWRILYDINNLSQTSLKKDVIEQLTKLKLELKQIKTDEERKILSLNSWKELKRGK